MDAAVRAWLLAQLGTTTDTADLELRLTRLGTARPVALEVLRERLASLLAQPASINVPGVVAINFGEIIKALERQIAQLEAGVPPAPDDPDEDGDGLPDGYGFDVIRLVERPRR
ncbi:hypothetical protein AB0D12_31680 [Streptomyces sp. NPDC048479]|uniref:hypothetical protein n=1 Tax=Streptomyces sp. NPDC048479 TaxID=3154725 RepID=UPI0034266135